MDAKAWFGEADETIAILRAGSETYSKKKFIQARPCSGNWRSLPQAKPMKIRLK